jgi:hypothetical protein
MAWIWGHGFGDKPLANLGDKQIERQMIIGIHDAIGKYADFQFLYQSCKKVQKLGFAFITGKNIIPVITAIHNVVNGAWICNSYSFHGDILPQSLSICTLHAPPPGIPGWNWE